MRRRRFAVLGLGQFGIALARELTRLGCEVLAVDVSQKRVDEMRDEVASAACADIRSRRALDELFTSPFDAVVVAIGGSLEGSILATLHLRDIGVPEIWAEANTDEHAEVLTRVGATRIVSPERDMGRRLAARFANPNLVEFLPVAEGYSIVEVEAPAWTHGKTLAELDLRRELDLAVISIRRSDGTVQVVPGGDARLAHGCTVTLVGRDANLSKFRERT